MIENILMLGLMLLGTHWLLKHIRRVLLRAGKPPRSRGLRHRSQDRPDDASGRSLGAARSHYEAWF